MNKVYVCGDTHIPIDISKLNTTNWPCQSELDKTDTLIILGDFGLLWEREWSKEELYWAKWLTKNNCTICFIDGNHENFDRINSLSDDIFHGGKVGVAYEDDNGRILHLKRGEIYTFGSKTVFTMGGALSIDKDGRTDGITWWKEEQPSIIETNSAIDNLISVDKKVDFILTHTCPNDISNLIVRSCKEIDSTRSFHDWVQKNIEFEKWYFGHFHTHGMYKDKFFCLCNEPPMRIL